jgi:hypothetical protein
MDRPKYVTSTEELADSLAAAADLEQRGEHGAAAHLFRAHELMARYFVEQRDARRSDDR